VTTIPVEAARLDRAAGAQDRPSPLARAVGARFDALLAARGMRCCKWIRLLAVAAALQIIPVSRGFPFLRGDGRNRRTDASPGGPLVGTLSSASLHGSSMTLIGVCATPSPSLPASADWCTAHAMRPARG